MRRPVAVWASIAAAVGVLDVWAAWNAREGDSLSEVIRSLFRTHTPAGRVALVLAWAGLTGWLLPHLLRGVSVSAQQE